MQLKKHVDAFSPLYFNNLLQIPINDLFESYHKQECRCTYKIRHHSRNSTGELHPFKFFEFFGKGSSMITL